MKILIGWLIASALGLLLWQPFGQAAKRGDEDALPQSDLSRARLVRAQVGLKTWILVELEEIT